MSKCSNCGKQSSIFSGNDECAKEDCTKAECGNCKGKILKECKKCEQTFCSEHINKHVCESEDEEEDNPIEEVSDNYVLINSEDYDDWNGFFESVEDYEKKGYEVKQFENCNDSNLFAIMRKIKG